MEAHFEKVAVGMTPSQVVRIMGEPSWEGQCGSRLGTGIPASCDREFGYSTTLAPLSPSYLVVFFGRNGVVIETAPINSP